MKKLLLTTILLPLTFIQANAECQKEYTEVARDIFINKVCSKMKTPDYRGNVFNKAYNIAEDMVEKYCENTPKVLCQDDIHKDAVAIIEAAEKYISTKPELNSLTDFKSYFQPVKEYIVTKHGLPQLSVDRHMDFDTYEETILLRNALEAPKKVEIEDIKKCNLAQRDTASLTCLGELKYFINKIYGTAKVLSGQTHLHFVSMCLRDSGFGECSHRQFVEK